MFYDMTWLERVLFLKRIKGGGSSGHEEITTLNTFVTDMVAPLRKLLLQLNPKTNMLNRATEGTGYISASGVVTNDNGVSSHSALISVTVGESYVFSGINAASSANKRVHAYDSNGIWISQLAVASSVAIDAKYEIQFVIPSGTSYIRVSYVKADTELRVYSQNRPIDGWDSVSVVRRGSNIVDWNDTKAIILNKITPSSRGETETGRVWFAPKSADGYPTIIGVESTNPKTIMAFKENTQYTIILDIMSESNSSFNIGVAYTDGTSVGLTKAMIVSGNTLVYTTTAGKTLKNIYVGQYTSTWTSLNLSKCFIGEGVLTADDFEPYAGQTYTTSLGQTVYGGTLDMVSGVLTVDRAMIDLGTGVNSWTYYSAQSYFYAIPPHRFANGQDGDGACDSYAFFGTKTSSYASSLPDKSFMFTSNAGNRYIYVKDTDYTTAADFKTAVTGKKLVYTLDEPIVYQLTPQQINTLIGTNNILTDAEVSEIVYLKKAE